MAPPFRPLSAILLALLAAVTLCQVSFALTCNGIGAPTDVLLNGASVPGAATALQADTDANSWIVDTSKLQVQALIT